MRNIKNAIRLFLLVLLIISYWVPYILVDIVLFLLVLQFIFTNALWVVKLPYRILLGKF